jgi:hypothetical protein
MESSLNLNETFNKLIDNYLYYDTQRIINLIQLTIDVSLIKMPYDQFVLFLESLNILECQEFKTIKIKIVKHYMKIWHKKRRLLRRQNVGLLRFNFTNNNFENNNEDEDDNLCHLMYECVDVLDTNKKNILEKEECLICYGNSNCELNCQHSFCEDCVIEHTYSSKKGCPMCSKDITKVMIYR